VQRLAESIAVVKAAWAGERFDFTGTHYTIRGYAGLPKPVQQPRPPILIGGGSERVLRLAGREADIVGIHVSTAALGTSEDAVKDTQDDTTRRKIVWVKEGAGERFPELELQLMCSATVTQDRRAAAMSLAATRRVTVDQVLGSAMNLVGSIDGLCEALYRRRQDWGISYFTIQAQACTDFAPVVARLAGK
jgi:alkanesulfonate monooxygenase SsuD/methylene tetrahydromethanopterin reductase-like flavin-dependent oxidoreductase (luciferase family)